MQVIAWNAAAKGQDSAESRRWPAVGPELDAGQGRRGWQHRTVCRDCSQPRCSGGAGLLGLAEAAVSLPGQRQLGAPGLSLAAVTQSGCARRF